MTDEHATWLVNLWIDNEQGPMAYVEELVEESGSVYEASQRLKDEYIDNMPETTGVYADLLIAALGSVDWFEVANQHKPESWGDATEAPEDTEDTDTDTCPMCGGACCEACQYTGNKAYIVNTEE